MDRKIILLVALFFALCFGAGAYFAFPLEAVSDIGETRIDDVDLRSVEDGEAIEVVFRGAGFGSDPRVSLSLDVANLKSVTGTLKTWAALQDVAVRGEIAVLANGDRGVQVVDISAPDQPFILGSIEVAGKAMAVDIVGQRAFVACAKGGVAVIDFSLPEDPFVAGTLFLPGVAWDVERIGEYLYIAAGRGGLQVVDISSPVAMRRLTSLPMEGHVVDLAPFGPTGLMLASVQGGVDFIDISDPLHPQVAGGLDPGEPALAVASGDGLGFVADVRGRLHVYDLLSDLAEPSLLGTIETIGRPSALAYHNDRVFAASRAGVHVVDVSVPARPRLSGTVGLRNPRGVDVHDGYIYVANSKAGLTVVDENMIQPLQVIDSFNSKGNALNLRLADRNLYLADGVKGLKIIEIDQEGRLLPVGEIPLRGSSRDVEVDGRYAYIADYQGGLDVVDISRPAQPRLLGSAETMGVAMALRLHEGLALVMSTKVTGQHGRGLQIFDVEDPARPQMLSELPLEDGSGIDVAVDEDRQTAYVVAGTAGVLAVDIADPRHPAIVGRYSLPWPEYSFSPIIGGVYRDGTLYVANARNGLLAIDVSDRTNPTLTGILPTRASALGVNLKDDRAYISLGGKGIAVADIGDPEKMRMVARLELPVFGRQLVVREEKVFLGNGHRGLFVVPAPVEAEIVSAAPTEVVCRFRTPPMAGTYSLSVFGEDSSAGVYTELPLPSH